MAAVFRFLAAAILLAHLIWILLVIFGAFWTRGRPVWTALHIVSLIWGVIVEVGPWPCPLTMAEEFFEGRAGVEPYQGGFLLHYLDKLVYPDIPGWLLATAGAAVCALNLFIYIRRWMRRRTTLLS